MSAPNISGINRLLYGGLSSGTSVSKIDKSNSFLSELQNAVNSLNLEDVFKNAASTYGVPENLLKAVAKVESGFNSNAVSSAGAQGIMQLMPSTSMSIGVQDPFNAVENVMAGAKLLSKFLNDYDGNTELALAAYNAGPGNVSKYGGIPPFTETQNYVKKVMSYYNDNIDLSNNIVSNMLPNISSTSVFDTPFSYDNSILNDYVNTSATDVILMKILQSQIEQEFNRNDNSEYEDMIF